MTGPAVDLRVDNCEEPNMTRPFIALAIGTCASAAITGASAQTLYVDGDYVAPAVPRTYVTPPAYAVPVVPAVPVAPPAYAVVPDYAVPAAPVYAAPPPVATPRVYIDRPRVVRRVIVERTAPPLPPYGYAGYEERY